jgi:uncharacterized protein (DUF934 family)
MKLLERTERGWAVRAPHPSENVLRLDNGDDLMAAPPALAGIDAVRLDFPAFKHGQAFTQARLLRSRYGYRGQIRAGGAIFRDQALFAARCGIDAFEVETEEEAQGFIESLAAYRDFYQPAEEGVPAFRRRAS